MAGAAQLMRRIMWLTRGTVTRQRGSGDKGDSPDETSFGHEQRAEELCA